MKEFEFDISLVIEDYVDYNLTFSHKMVRATNIILFWLFPFTFICIAIGMIFDPFRSIEELSEVKNFITQQTGKEFRFVHLNKQIILPKLCKR